MRERLRVDEHDDGHRSGGRGDGFSGVVRSSGSAARNAAGAGDRGLDSSRWPSAMLASSAAYRHVRAAQRPPPPPADDAPPPPPPLEPPPPPPLEPPPPPLPEPPPLPPPEQFPDCVAPFSPKSSQKMIVYAPEPGQLAPAGWEIVALPPATSALPIPGSPPYGAGNPGTEAVAPATTFAQIRLGAGSPMTPVNVAVLVAQL